MSKQNQEIADLLASKLEAGDSPFQIPGKRMPVNPITGKNYRGMNALWLGMQDRQDPRWMTLRQASNKAGLKIAQGSKGTLISFLKTTDRVTLLDNQGNPQLNTNRKPKTELIKLEHPVEASAYVFNAEQVEGIQPLSQVEAKVETWLKQNPPAEQLAKLVEASKAIVEETTGEPGYDASDRIIYMPPVEQFQSEAAHNAALLYELVKFAGHDQDLYDPLDVSTAEQIKPALAALFLGNEMGISSQLAPQLVPEDIHLVAKSDPEELEFSANAAQYITDYLVGLDNPRDRRQTANTERSLQVGDIIDYNEKQYEVMGKLRGGDLQVMDKSTESRFRVGRGDGIYHNLLNARNETYRAQHEAASIAAQAEILGPEEEQDHSMEHEHADELEQEHTQGKAPVQAGETEPEQGQNLEAEDDMPLVLNQDNAVQTTTGKKR